MTRISTVELGSQDAFPVVFGHGWGRSHADFVPVAELIAPRARAILLDFPGFGDSPRPEQTWDTADYAKAVRTHLADHLQVDRFVWVGHSFGGRVGLRLAAMPKSPVAHLFVIAGAGIKRRRALPDRIKAQLRSWAFQRKKAQTTSEAALIELERRYGSVDYLKSRELGLRDIFVKTVQEDQSNQVGAITCATTLIYGGRDTETPPAIGRRLHELIGPSTYVECPEFNHLSILTRGRHLIATMLLEQLEEVGT